MTESEDIQKLKLQVSLINAAVHAIATALAPAERNRALALFQRIAEHESAALLAQPITEPVLAFAEEMRASLERALSP